MKVQAHNSKPPVGLRQALAETEKPDIELAFEIGVNITTIWRWRTGKSIPASQATRDRLAEVLGRSIAFPSRPERAAA